MGSQRGFEREESQDRTRALKRNQKGIKQAGTVGLLSKSECEWDKEERHWGGRGQGQSNQGSKQPPVDE